MLDALNAAFHPEESMRARDGISLPDALWDSAPPLAIRDRSGEISFANPAFKGLYDSLKAANALAPTEDLATVIQGLGHSYTEHLQASRRNRALSSPNSYRSMASVAGCTLCRIPTSAGKISRAL
jgi:hypothetical protein